MLADIIRAGLVLIMLFVFLGTNRIDPEERIRGRLLFLIGFLLLLFGDRLNLLPSPETSEFMASPFGVWLEANINLVSGFLLISAGMMMLYRSLTELRTADAVQTRTTTRLTGNQELQNSQVLLNSVLNSSLNGVFVLKAVRDDLNRVVDFECQVMNPAAEQIIGRPSSELVGRRLLKELPCIRQTKGLFEDGISVIETGLPFNDERYCTDGNTGRWYQIVAVSQGDGLAVTFADVSYRKQNEEQLRHAAQHDTLTSLPNRALFTERLEQALVRSKRIPGYRIAVLFLDFDRFKIINDTLGHDIGDQLLIGISNRLRNNLRSLDTAARGDGGHLPARLGGDEFVVLLDGIGSESDAMSVADRLLGELAAPHDLDGHEVVSTASIGIVHCTGDYDRPDDIIRDADTAMYRAKTSGKARCVVFDDSMRADAQARVTFENELTEAATQESFALGFDPVLALEEGSLLGFQVTPRWPHPTRGLLDSSAFMPIAEKLGFDVAIGAWMLREACLTMKIWQTQHVEHQGLRLDVRLTRSQLLDDETFTLVKTVLEETAFAPSCLRLLVSESVANEDPTRMAAVLERLHGLGVTIVMDDFGTGFASLTSPRQFPVGVLKLDPGIFDDSNQPGDALAVARALCVLAHGMELQVMCGGITDDSQLSLLREVGCDIGQGALFSQPLDSDEVGRLLRRETTLGAAA